MKSAAVFLACLMLSLPAFGSVIRVPADQPTIQAGIDVAVDGDTVLVADGTYTGWGNRDIILHNKAITIISENGPANCIIDCEDHDVRAFVITGVVRTTVIEGFTITGFMYAGLGYTVQGGGGIVISFASPVIRGNYLTGNRSYNGGAIKCINSGSPLIEGNFIADNLALGSGGGIYCGYHSNPIIRNNVIHGNTAGRVGGYRGYGGGIFCTAGDVAYLTVVENNVITDNIAVWAGGWPYPERGGGICSTGTVILRGNYLSGNSATHIGSAISSDGWPLITGNTITGNIGPAPAVALNATESFSTSDAGVELTPVDRLLQAGTDGAPFNTRDTIDGAVVTHNIISGNGGGGMKVSNKSYIANNLIVDNGEAAEDWGGGIYLFEADSTVLSCTIAGNRDESIYARWDTTILVTDTILWNNQGGATGNEIYLGSYESGPTELTISYSDLPGGQTAVESTSHATLNWGPGMIDANPLFVTGPSSTHYLDQVAAGQTSNSPCVDSGSGAAENICFPSWADDQCLDELITRTDRAADQGTVDMGYHHQLYAEEPDTSIGNCPNGLIDSPVITFCISGIDDIDPPTAMLYSWRLDGGPWSEYSPATTATVSGFLAGSHTFEVRSRDSDGNIDPTPAACAFAYEPWLPDQDWHGLVTGPGPNLTNPPLVRTEFAEWLAYGVMHYGVNLATGDIDSDGTDEVITGPGPGTVFGPHVRCYEPDGSLIHDAGFLAYGTHKYGVNVACGDIDGDGYDEIVTGAGPGPVFGPHVRGWDRTGSDPAWQPIPDVNFFAYGTPKWGVNVACGDIDGDGIDEIVTGAGPGAVYGAHVRGWNWDGSGTATAIPGVSYFAYGTPQWGVNVACGDINADGRDEIITGPGPGPEFASHIRGWRFNGTNTPALSGVNFFAHPDSNYGAVVACGDIDGDDRAEIVFNYGPSAARTSDCDVFRYMFGEISLVRSFRPYDDWMTHGGKVAVGTFE